MGNWYCLEEKEEEGVLVVAEVVVRGLMVPGEVGGEMLDCLSLVVVVVVLCGEAGRTDIWDFLHA